MITTILVSGNEVRVLGLYTDLSVSHDFSRNRILDLEPLRRFTSAASGRISSRRQHANALLVSAAGWVVVEAW
jgi:hypothetical protein